MDTDVRIQHNVVDTKSNLPIPHLSFIIQFLLPKRLVGYERSEKENQFMQEFFADYTQLNNGSFTPVFIGSMAEGYHIPDVFLRSSSFEKETNSDHDILLIKSGLSICEDMPSLTERESKLRLDFHGTHPGYARIESLQPKAEDKKIVFLKESKQYFLSSTKIMAMAKSSLCPPCTIDGPALCEKPVKTVGKTQTRPHDYVCALPCEKWPEVAKLWIERQMKGEWLDESTLIAAVQSGVHVVACSHKLNKLPESEWRLSFAVTEKYLAKTVVTDEQRQCFVFLKIIYLQTLKELDLLTSYHLKTIFYYSCEKLPNNIWTENPGGCLLFMIDILIECIEKRLLPMFFIPENNLIDHFTDEQIASIKTVLESIREDPLKPILEFTDKNIIGLQSEFTPFREIISPILKDMVDFLEHKDIQRSVMTAYGSAFGHMVFVLVAERKPEEAVNYIMDTFPTFDKYGHGSIRVPQIVDSIANNLLEVIKYSDQHPGGLQLWGNLACMFHALAYKYPEDSEEHMVALGQAERHFNSVVDDEDIYSPTVIDFCCLLIKQGRFDKAAEKLNRIIAKELNHPTSWECFYMEEAKVLDKTLQKEVQLRGQLIVNSLSMAYYLLMKCVLKNDLYKKNLESFNKHCSQINTSESYSLLGYSFMNNLDWEGAKQAFQDAQETCNGSVRLIKENLTNCNKKLERQVQ